MYFPGANAFATCGPVNCETLFQNLIKLNSVKLRLRTVDFPQSLKGMRKGKLRFPSVTAFRSNSIFFSGESRPSDKGGGGVHKNFFRSFGPQFRLTIKRDRAPRTPLPPSPWIHHCFYIPYHFDMIFSLLLCISPWEQQHLTIRVNIQVTNQPFPLWLEKPSNTLNLLFWQRLFTMESLATRITACSSNLMKNSKKHGWKTSFGQQVLLLLFLCRPPGLWPKLEIIVLLVDNWSLYSRRMPDMLQSKEDIILIIYISNDSNLSFFYFFFLSLLNGTSTQLLSKQFTIVTCTFLVCFPNFWTP